MFDILKLELHTFRPRLCIAYRQLQLTTSTRAPLKYVHRIDGTMGIIVAEFFRKMMNHLKVTLELQARHVQ